MARTNTAQRVRRSLGFACIAALLTAPVAWAGINPQPFRTGLFGVTAGQAVRISVVNTGDAKGVINPCFRVWDAAGALLLETDGGPLPEGMGTFVDFNPFPPSGGPPPPVGFRAQLRAEVELLPAVHPSDRVAAQAVRRRAVLLTLEVFDIATGKTKYTTPFATVAGIDPQPFAPVAGIDPTPFAGVDPQPFRTGLFGVTPGQSIRISVLNAGDAAGTINPCFHVWDAAGALLVERDAGPLPGGIGTFMDFDPFPPTGGPPPPAGSRLQLRADVELLPAVRPTGRAAAANRRAEILLTLEVFDTATGQTVFTMPIAKVAFNPQPEPPEPIR